MPASWAGGRAGRQAALPVGAERARVRGLPRRRVGPPGPRRPGDVRADLPRGVPVRPVLADHPAQAGELPQGVRRVRHRLGGGVHRRGPGAAAGRRGHRAQPGQDQRRHHQRPGRPGAGRRAERPGLELRRRRARPAPRTLGDLPAKTPASVALAKELRRRGFVFTGPVTVYAAMQACGLVNDHLEACFARAQADPPADPPPDPPGPPIRCPADPAYAGWRATITAV